MEDDPIGKQQETLIATFPTVLKLAQRLVGITKWKEAENERVAALIPHVPQEASGVKDEGKKRSCPWGFSIT